MYDSPIAVSIYEVTWQADAGTRKYNQLARLHTRYQVLNSVENQLYGSTFSFAPLTTKVYVQPAGLLKNDNRLL